VQSVGVTAIVGRDGIFGKDIRVFHPLIVFWAIAFPLHHVPEAAVDFCLEDLFDIPSDIIVCPEDGWRFIVLGASGEWVWLHKLELHHWKGWQNACLVSTTAVLVNQDLMNRK
jgi:hypothetical protein